MASLVAQMVKNLPAMQETPASTPRSGRSSEEENGNPLQYPCLENPMDREAWWATTHKLQSDTRLSNFHFTDTCDHPESANFIWTDPTVNQWVLGIHPTSSYRWEPYFIDGEAKIKTEEMIRSERKPRAVASNQSFLHVG